MKNFLKNKPWKTWRTRKITFVGVLCFLLVYTGLCILLAWYDHTIDSTVTTEVFKTGRWIIVTGTSIVLSDAAAKILKKDDDIDE